MKQPPRRLEVVKAPAETGRHPWHRCPNESAKAYEAFSVYRNMGPGRSTHKAAEALGKSWALTRQWCTKWDWRARSRAWDAHLEQRQNEAFERASTATADEIASMNRRHADMAVALQRKALARLQELAPADLNARDVLAYLLEAVKLERGARGEPEVAGDDETSEQEWVARLLADPASAQLAARLAASAVSTNGHG